MSTENWYYVEKGERRGPVAREKLIELVRGNQLSSEDYVWLKGFENWKKLKEVPEILKAVEVNRPSVVKYREVNALGDLENEGAVIFIRTGLDRTTGGAQEFGPYTFETLKKLFEQKRINEKTLVFVRGMSSWKILGEFSDFAKIFSQLPPEIKLTPANKREYDRRPFVTRMFFHDNNNLYEGVCRDVSLGGMQVLVAGFPGREGDKISMNVHPDNSAHHFMASGQVVRMLESGQGFSFKFIDLSNDAKQAIQNYLNEIN